VEIVRRFMGTMERSFEAYWRNPRSIATAVEADTLWPENREALRYLHPDFEWQTVMEQTHRGYLETAKVWDDYLTWAADYRIGVQEATDLGDDRVYAVITLTGTAEAGGTPMNARFFDLFTLRDGVIVRIAEYTERDKALEGAGLSE
jgi:ketosteroid isomerase-like protein